jgi:hypothetical protein
MNRIFAITAASERVSVGADGRGEITFTVTNSSARPLRGQLRVRPLGSTKGEWLSVAGETERAFSPNATQQVVVKVATPPGAPAGKYQFRLDTISVINPDDDFTEGPTVDLEVKATEAPKKAFPWWIVAAAAGGVILIVTLTWWLWPSGGVEAPDVVGLDVAEATKKFEDLKFKVEVTKQLNSTVGLNRVFAQDPQGKAMVKEGSAVMLFVASQKPDETKVVFEDNFDGAWKDVWSHTKMEMTPKTRTRYLGPFFNEAVKLTVDNLPPHKTVTVKFNLYVACSWDGDSAGSGPDVWGLRLEDSLDLVHTTFSNVDGVSQKFACQAGEDASSNCYSKGGVAASGATINTLGLASWPRIQDSLYTVKRTFPHNRSFLMLTFFADLKEVVPENRNAANESWGLDNVRIEVQ